MTTIIEAAYEGSTAVRVDGHLYTYTREHAQAGILPRTARRLIKNGADPATPVRVTRDGTTAFEGATLAQWASITCEEPDNARRGIRVRTYRPHSSERQNVKTGEEAPLDRRQADALVVGPSLSRTGHP